jgi:hypothetical protein
LFLTEQEATGTSEEGHHVIACAGFRPDGGASVAVQLCDGRRPPVVISVAGLTCETRLLRGATTKRENKHAFALRKNAILNLLKSGDVLMLLLSSARLRRLEILSSHNCPACHCLRCPAPVLHGGCYSVFVSFENFFVTSSSRTPFGFDSKFYVTGPVSGGTNHTHSGGELTSRSCSSCCFLSPESSDPLTPAAPEVPT